MSVEVLHGDCLDILPTLPDASVDMILTDPPYFNVKIDQAWDRRWKNAAAYLAWLDRVAEQWARVLKPNGSLYCFASPRMAGRVEMMLSARFEILTHIVWVKEENKGADGFKRRRDHGQLRSWLPYSERIIFAEHLGSDPMALGESGYAAQCERLRGFVFEPLRAYFDAERVRAGVSMTAIMDWFAAKGLPRYMTARHTFTASQWALPTPENYEALRQCFADLGAATGEYLRREYEYLRREYEYLRREYEDLRRPFAVTADDQYTDVWEFPIVHPYPGKHPCEKPLALLRHAITASTRPGALVLDCFAGSGAVGIACRDLGRSAVLIEEDSDWIERINVWLKTPSVRPVRARIAAPGQLSLPMEAAE